METLIRNGERFYKVSEVSRMLGVDISTVYRWARMSEMPASRVNGCILINKDAFETWLKSKENNGGIRHAV